MTAEKTGDHCAAPDCSVVADSACAVHRMEAVFGSLVALSEPQPDVIIEVKLVCWCLCHCRPKYSLSSRGKLRTPSKSLCIHIALVHECWHQMGPSEHMIRPISLQMRTLRRRGETCRAHCQVEPELEAALPAPPPVLQFHYSRLSRS